VIAAWKAGSDFVKIFPCGSVGGCQLHQWALKAPLPQVPMVPTGGINLNTAADFIAPALPPWVSEGVGFRVALESGNTNGLQGRAKLCRRCS